MNAILLETQKRVQKLGRAFTALPDSEALIISGQDVAQFFNKVQPVLTGWLNEEIEKAREQLSSENSQAQATILTQAKIKAERATDSYIECYLPALIGEQLEESSLVRRLTETQPKIDALTSEIDRLRTELTQAKVQSEQDRAEVQQLAQELSLRSVMKDSSDELASLKLELEELKNRPQTAVQAGLTAEEVQALIAEQLSKMEVMNPSFAVVTKQKDWSDFDFETDVKVGSSSNSKKEQKSEIKLTGKGDMFRVDQFRADNTHIPAPKVQVVLQELIQKGIITKTTETNTFRVV